MTEPIQPQPLRRSVSRAELIDEARKWVKSNYGDVALDYQHQALGLLVDFIADIIPEDKPCVYR